MLAAIDHVQLAAPPGSEDPLRRYYTGALGMTEIPKPPPLAARGGCWFRAGAVQIHVGITQNGTEHHRAPADKAHTALTVTDLDACAARLHAHGARVTWDDALPGRRRFYSWDPAGNRLEFLAAGHGRPATARMYHQ